jgi:hypothetical protein
MSTIKGIAAGLAVPAQQDTDVVRLGDSLRWQFPQATYGLKQTSIAEDDQKQQQNQSIAPPPGCPLAEECGEGQEHRPGKGANEEEQGF